MKLSEVLGPVFAFEWLRGARRWQLYAGRAAFVLVLLAILAWNWMPLGQRPLRAQELATIGRRFLVFLTFTQLAIILIAAPAATAGALCVDKGRGTLLHTFTTDLSDREIVVGKLAVRLAGVLTLPACGLPVLALTILLGGVDPWAVVGAYLVTAGVAAFACALGLTFSVWARKPHQALLPAYALLGLWVGAYAILEAVVGRSILLTDPIDWAFTINPFVLFVAAQELTTPWGSGLTLQIHFVGALVLLAGALTGVAVWRLRPVALRQADRPARRERPGLPARLLSLIPGPSLDGNPVLWREWHRKRPSRWTGRLWTAYAIGAGLASLYVLFTVYSGDIRGIALAAQVNGWGVSFGLLLLSISAATSLAEERDQRSLEVILATPLPTWMIVLGKWWGSFALVPRLAILPIWVGTGLALVSGRWAGLLSMIGLILAYAAAVTSLGLAVATWERRPGRAAAGSALLFVLMSLSPLALQPLGMLMDVLFGGPAAPESWEWVVMASPYLGVTETTTWAGRIFRQDWGVSGLGGGYIYRGASHPSPWNVLYWMGFDGLLALLLAIAVWLSFDRCLGRVPDHPRQPRRTPRHASRRGVS